MPTHAEKRTLPYTPRQLYDLVADVDKYPEFLPWVQSAKISQRQIKVLSVEGSGLADENFLANIVIGYKIFTYPYRCRVHLKPEERIDIEYLEGPFSRLNNHWVFTPINEKLTEIDFFIDFEFHTSALQAILQPVFSEVVRRMIGAFEKRAKEIY